VQRQKQKQNAGVLRCAQNDKQQQQQQAAAEEEEEEATATVTAKCVLWCARFA
jgi:hypothetical protein